MKKSSQFQESKNKASNSRRRKPAQNAISSPKHAANADRCPPKIKLRPRNLLDNRPPVENLVKMALIFLSETSLYHDLLQVSALCLLPSSTAWLRRTSKSQFLLLDPRQYSNQHQYACRQDSPQFDVQHIQIVIRLRCRCHRRQQQRQHQVSRQTMPLVQALGIVHASIQLRHVVGCKPDQCLDGEQDVSDESENGMCGHKMCAVVRELVVLDDNQAGDQGVQGQVIEDEVRDSAFAFLVGRVGWLKEEDGLREHE